MLKPKFNSNPLSDQHQSPKSANKNSNKSIEVATQEEPFLLPFVSLVIPAYNEAAILETNLAIVCDYMKSIEAQYRWELIIVNDGSKDETGKQAETWARSRQNVFVVHHPHNLGLGQALRTGFEHCQGDYIITLDLDLSYAPDKHIEPLLSEIRLSGAKIVIASPYRKGGQVSNVPWLRRLLSIWANQYLSIVSGGEIKTFTGMVRAYDAKFVKSLNLTATSMEINPEIIYKTLLLKGKIVEIPAHLQWLSPKKAEKQSQRQSSMKILRHTGAILFWGFLLGTIIDPKKK